MGQNELDLVKTLTAAPVLDCTSPAVASVTQSMDEDDGRRVLGDWREQERRGARD